MTLGSHQKSVGDSDNWITPRWIIDRLGPFDLDPAAALPRPWPCADKNYTVNGLIRPWKGFVWLNPPFNRFEIGAWMLKMGQHNNGIALLHARCETDWFQSVWKHATDIVFLSKRLRFYRPDGSEAEHNSGAPPVLVGYGGEAKARLARSLIKGTRVYGWTTVV